MTRQREFKALVRERMSKTGERYTAARAHLLTQPSESLPPSARLSGMLDRYDSVGGVQGDTGALCNVLRHAGITSPIDGRPYNEAAVHGLCGGPGFLYATFEYKGWPPMLSLALRSRSMDDLFVSDGLARFGVRVTVSETTSAAAARKALDSALSQGKAALCVTDFASLPWYGLPREYAGGAPHVIAVVGRDGDSVWIDDRSPRPFRLTLTQLADARARYKAAKHRLITIDGPSPRHDAKAAIRDAVATTARRYTRPEAPKSFWVNCGFSGLDKWRDLLTDTKDKKGWPTLFADGAHAYSGLQRAYDCIEGPYGTGGGRAFYAEFLDHAAGEIDSPPLKKAASAYRESAAGWTEAAALIADCGDHAVRQACEMADRRFELADSYAQGESNEPTQLWRQRHTLADRCQLSRESALALYTKLAALVRRISDAERAAVASLSAA